MQQPYLYSIIEKGQLKEMLESFQICIDLPIQVIDEKGSILESELLPVK